MKDTKNSKTTEKKASTSTAKTAEKVTKKVSEKPKASVSSSSTKEKKASTVKATTKAVSKKAPSKKASTGTSASAKKSSSKEKSSVSSKGKKLNKRLKSVKVISSFKKDSYTDEVALQIMGEKLLLSSDKSYIKISDKAFYATGKRKAAIARIYMWEAGKNAGDIWVNNTNCFNYFKSSFMNLSKIHKPFGVTDLNISDYFIVCIVKGGGIAAQSAAIQLGLSRIIVLMNSDLRKILKHNKLLTRDSRVVESKKVGLRKARKSEQYSKR